MFEGGNKGISRMFQGSWVFPGRLRGDSREDQVYQKDFLREIHGSFNDVLRKI